MIDDDSAVAGGGRLGGDNWQKRYVRVDEAKAQLCYWKSSDMQEKAQGAIDLKVVQEIAAYEKKGGADYSRFNVDAGDKVRLIEHISCMTYAGMIMPTS